jgi:hypothetical protein
VDSHSLSLIFFAYGYCQRLDMNICPQRAVEYNIAMKIRVWYGTYHHHSDLSGLFVFACVFDPKSLNLSALELELQEKSSALKTDRRL